VRVKLFEMNETITGEKVDDTEAFAVFVTTLGGDVERRQSGQVNVTVANQVFYLVPGEWLISYGNDDLEVLPDAKVRRRLLVKASV
jgi:hypothetical protein